MEPLAFVLATAALLSTPGPTNTLLTTSGAGIGLWRSLPLLAAELGGYLTAILLLMVAIGPFVSANPLLGIALRAVITFYLLHLAIAIWYHAGSQLRAEPVTFLRVLITTFLNPKAIIFAFVILPSDRPILSMLPWLLLLGLQMLAVGAAWIAVGAWLRLSFRGAFQTRVVYRASAVTLAVFAGTIGIGAIRLA
jgi:threonine/homoserine/homoserine lactone efflux protein